MTLNLGEVPCTRKADSPHLFGPGSSGTGDTPPLTNGARVPDRWHRSASSGRSIWSNGSRGPRLYVYVGQAKLIGKRGHTGIYHRMSPKRLHRTSLPDGITYGIRTPSSRWP